MIHSGWQMRQYPGQTESQPQLKAGNHDNADRLEWSFHQQGYHCRRRLSEKKRRMLRIIDFHFICENSKRWIVHLKYAVCDPETSCFFHCERFNSQTKFFTARAATCEYNQSISWHNFTYRSIIPTNLHPFISHSDQNFRKIEQWTRSSLSRRWKTPTVFPNQKLKKSQPCISKKLARLWQKGIAL